METNPHLLIKNVSSLARQERIKVLGGFGNYKQKRLPDKTKFTRKMKHAKKDPRQGPFDFNALNVILEVRGAIIRSFFGDRHIVRMAFA